ncbi:hypothetical protein RHODO2019_07530 [Rhodococcus antarcticus]|jgi:hypothetical protein|uniref:ABC-type Mn/Zn transport systems, ATPase component n=1 Tax=Rhodococcus antarcticus TaxID=2987751 RepID=A0ABY6P3L6_9NOCA|nr:hypothetical protein [Rhodococcus antarcticus]UZJ26249.1 hypothetical protein RHODO2019_07530 [Rhodococcus antarcticus]
MTRNTVSRALHDVGLAAWFGGTLANAVALNPAAAQAKDPEAVGHVTNDGWDRWTPVNAAAIGAHLLGSLGQLRGNRSRLAHQDGVAAMATTKTVLTVAALAVTGYSRVVGSKVSDPVDPPVHAGTEPIATTPPEVRGAQAQLRYLQWAVPALTGALVVISAFAGEQQRPASVVAGLVSRVRR